MNLNFWHTPGWTPTGYTFEPHVLLTGSARCQQVPLAQPCHMGPGVLLHSEILAWASQLCKCLLSKGHGEGRKHRDTCGSLLPFPQIAIMFYWYWFYCFLVPRNPGGKGWASCVTGDPQSPARRAAPACVMGAVHRQSQRKMFPDPDKLPLILACFQLEVFACIFECKIFCHYFCETEFRIEYSLPKTSFLFRFEKNFIRLQFQTFSCPISFLLS